MLSFAHLGLVKLYPSTSTRFNYFPERQKAITLQGVAANLHKTSHYRARTQGMPSRKRTQPFMQSHVRHSLYKAQHCYTNALLLKHCPEKMRKLVQWRLGHMYFFFSRMQNATASGTAPSQMWLARVLWSISSIHPNRHLERRHSHSKMADKHTEGQTKNDSTKCFLPRFTHFKNARG